MAYIFARMIFFSTKPSSMYAPKCRGLYKQLDKNEYHIRRRIKGEKHNQDNIMPFKPSSKLFANTRNMWFPPAILHRGISFIWKHTSVQAPKVYSRQILSAHILCSRVGWRQFWLDYGIIPNIWQYNYVYNKSETARKCWLWYSVTGSSKCVLYNWINRRIVPPPVMESISRCSLRSSLRWHWKG